MEGKNLSATERSRKEEKNGGRIQLNSHLNANVTRRANEIRCERNAISDKGKKSIESFFFNKMSPRKRSSARVGTRRRLTCAKESNTCQEKRAKKRRKKVDMLTMKESHWEER